MDPPTTGVRRAVQKELIGNPEACRISALPTPRASQNDAADDHNSSRRKGRFIGFPRPHDAATSFVLLPGLPAIVFQRHS